MGDYSLQEAEKVYIIHGVQDNIRNDGRGCLDYRTIELETDNIIPNSTGSALVQIGETKAIAGVKAELTSPLPHSPSKGWIEISIESTPHANLEFEGRGGDDFASDISQILMQVCNNDKLIDLKKLCVIPGEQVWALYVDIMVIGYDGNFMDVVSIVTKAALFNTKIQSVTVKCDANNVPEIEFPDDPNDVFSLDVTNLPIFLTLNRVGSEFIIDATREEEACSKAKLLLAVCPTQVVLMKEMGGPGSLHIDSISDVIDTGKEIGTTLQKKINEILEEEKKLPKVKKFLL